MRAMNFVTDSHFFTKCPFYVSLSGNVLTQDRLGKIITTVGILMRMQYYAMSPLQSGVTNCTNRISTHYTINCYKNICVLYFPNIYIYIYTYVHVYICTCLANTNVYIYLYKCIYICMIYIFTILPVTIHLAL